MINFELMKAPPVLGGAFLLTLDMDKTDFDYSKLKNVKRYRIPFKGPMNIPSSPPDTTVLKAYSHYGIFEGDMYYGKVGMYWICYCPERNVSGYGDTLEEAENCFEEYIKTYHADIGL